MLFQKGVNWNEYPVAFKRGTYFARRHEKTKFSAEELDRLPLKHAARQNPDLEIIRSVVKKLDIPPLNRINNKEGVLFSGEIPINRDNSSGEAAI